MLFKFVLLAGIFFVIYIMFFKKKAVKNQHTNKKPTQKGDIMMECTECGVFVSEDEAIIKDGKFYCSKQCAGVR